MTKRILAIFCIVFLLISIFPVSAFADPVSAAVIANSFAQAIAAYGASNGVSMVFDITNTSNIGETVHDLWTRFRSSQQTADDYDTLASTLFPGLYRKIEVAAAGIGIGNYVACHIDNTFAEYFDEFYNWLLSGPLELVQVDNQYYQFDSSQIGANSVPINVASIRTTIFSGQPVSGNYYNQNNAAGFNAGYLIGVNSEYKGPTAVCPASDNCYFFFIGETVYCINPYNKSAAFSQNMYYNNSSYIGRGTASSYSGTYNGQSYQYSYNNPNVNSYNPKYGLSFASINDALATIFGEINTPPENLGIQAYSESGIADFPDTADPNYDALNRAKDIPLDTPWDDTSFGDGEVISSAESAAISDIISQAIEQDNVIDLVEEMEIPDVPDLSEVFIPLLPITLPSFNFSLAGIWHYVRDWVNSISSFLSLTLSVWSWLPYAISLPVYASLVIVIVLGLYKRFFM